MASLESTPEFVANVYKTMHRNLRVVRRKLGRPLTLAEFAADNPKVGGCMVYVGYKFRGRSRLAIDIEKELIPLTSRSYVLLSNIFLDHVRCVLLMECVCLSLPCRE